MNMKSKNLEILELLGTSENFLKLSQLEGIETLAMDTSEEIFLKAKKTLWLRWNDEYFFNLEVTEEAQKIIDAGERVKNKGSQLYRALRPDYQVMVKAKILETGQEGILAIKQKRIRSKIEEAIKNETIREIDLLITTQVDQKKNGGKNIVKVITPIPKKENYISKIEWPDEKKGSEKSVNFYLKTLEKLARGEKLNADQERQHFFDILNAQKEGKEEEKENIEMIFGKDEKDNLLEKFLKIQKKKNIEMTAEILKKIQHEEGLRELIAKYE